MDFNKDNTGGIYFYKLNNGESRTICKIYLKLTMITTERRLPILTLKKQMPAEKQFCRKFTRKHFSENF